MTRDLSTAPVLPAGTLADSAQPQLPAARGARVASRAVRALSAWALDDIGFHRLELDHSTRNEASCRVALASGYAWEGTKRSAALHDDGRHDMHLHALVRDDLGRRRRPHRRRVGPPGRGFSDTKERTS